MQLLIDTHILIWFLEGNKSLSKPRRQIIANPQNDVFVSISSLWEIAIKISISKLTLAKPLADAIKQIAVEDIEILPILPEHTLQVSTLPFHHRL
jgi:PIN domain nuclease of toxin-antitoxin system